MAADLVKSAARELANAKTQRVASEVVDNLEDKFIRS